VDLSDPLDLDRTVLIGSGEGPHLGLDLRPPAARYGTGLDDGVEAEAPGGDGEVDEASLDAGKPMVSSTSSIASSRVCRA
jgi:hypothetical protein